MMTGLIKSVYFPRLYRGNYSFRSISLGINICELLFPLFLISEETDMSGSFIYVEYHLLMKHNYLLMNLSFDNVNAQYIQ